MGEAAALLQVVLRLLTVADAVACKQAIGGFELMIDWIKLEHISIGRRSSQVLLLSAIVSHKSLIGRELGEFWTLF